MSSTPMNACKWFGLLFLVMGLCSTAQAAETSEERLTEILFSRMAVAPTLVGQRQPNINERLDDTLSCPIDEICTDDPAIAPLAGQRMMQMVHDAMARRFGPHMVDPAQVRAAYTDIRLDGAQDTPRVMVEQLGRLLSADLVLVVTLWRYRDRDTQDGFVEKPAAVAFAIYLVEPSSGRQLWRAIYDESQEFATSDAVRFGKRVKMGLNWLSADELARHGIKEALSAFPQRVKPR